MSLYDFFKKKSDYLLQLLKFKSLNPIYIMEIRYSEETFLDLAWNGNSPYSFLKCIHALVSFLFYIFYLVILNPIFITWNSRLIPDFSKHTVCLNQAAFLNSTQARCCITISTKGDPICGCYCLFGFTGKTQCVSCHNFFLKFCSPLCASKQRFFVKCL